MAKRRTLQEIETLLNNFCLLVWCIEKDCGNTSYLKNIKRKAKELRKELNNVPVPTYLRK